MTCIVVGVDGSEHSLRALRFALEEARIRHCGLKVVSVWHVPALAYETGYTPASLDFGDFEQVAGAGLAKSLEEAAADEAGVEVTTVMREGHPADVLIEESRNAELLVVGSRGLGGFRGLLQGSVSRQCANHAFCPVAVLPAAV